LSITSNDPLNPVKVVNLKGKGFSINPAPQKVLFAGSGLGNDGKMLTIDKATGQGTILGSSLFEEIKSIAVNPVTGIMYGVTTNNIDSELLRINSTEGDGYLLHTINIALLAGISFDKDGNLYTSTIFGEIYSVNLDNGGVTMIVDADVSTASITFNPFTNELWATSRNFIGPNADKVFKIDITTGETTLIGHTGLGTITNDLAFDEEGNLYGIIGGSSNMSTFISINKSNGEGNVIGEIGFENIQCLAYNAGDVSSIENENLLPTEFLLLQNYPNPFNPSTTITYQLPRAANVSLIIYNSLGEKLAELVKGEVPAGVHNFDFKAQSFSSGIYFYTLRINNGSEFLQTRKMILLK
ncbi:MAG: T9SS type A sorting domain-containing protein, partial [Nitrososphaeraceae archaeon]|nr:T9SS type A sorting domain-containing protein [Nitrososphaeraceae archaeon]